MSTKANVLLVEDDPNLGFVIKDHLEMNHYQVSLCKDGEEAWRSFLSGHYHICILDVMMPKRDGISLAQEIRKASSQIPILFLTAKSLKEDRIAGFKAGGDDYILKPFSMEELMLRMEVFLKRSHSSTEGFSSVFTIGKFNFDSESLTLEGGEDTIYLTQKEAEILKLLCINKNKVLKREEILVTVWGNDDYFTSRSLDVFISKLRSYMKKDSRLEILNIRSVGFKMSEK